MQHDASTVSLEALAGAPAQSRVPVQRLQWERAKSQYHGGAQRIALWDHMPALRFFDAGEWWRLSACHLRTRYDRDHFQQIMQDHPLPRRWRLRHNDRVRLLCDASSFIAALARLHQPEGSFRTFSQAG